MKFPLPRFLITNSGGDPSGHRAVHEADVLEMEALLLKYEMALRTIAIPARRDGSYNRDRKACQKLAQEALK